MHASRLWKFIAAYIAGSKAPGTVRAGGGPEGCPSLPAEVLGAGGGGGCKLIAAEELGAPGGGGGGASGCELLYEFAAA